MQDFIGSEPLLDRPIAFHRCFMSVTTNCPVGALYLSQAWFWRGRGKKDDGWIYKTHEEFFLETGLSKKQQIRVRKVLQTKDWWEEKVERIGTVPTFHYRIDRVGLMRDLEAQRELSESAQRELSESAQRELSESAQRELSESAQRELSSIYTKNTKQRIPTENTHTPDARAEKSFGENFGRGENTGVPPVNPSPPIPLGGTPSDRTFDESLVQPEPITQSLEVFPISGEERSSGGGDIVVSESTQRFNDSFNYSNDIGSLTAELVRIYNNGKPSNWAGFVGESGAVRRKIKQVIDRYRRNGESERLVEDWKNALLWYRSSDFHSDREKGVKFGSGNIFWVCEGERVEVAAANWKGASKAVVKKVAVGVLEKEILDWRDGKPMGKYTLDALPRVIRKMYIHNTEDKPSWEWMEKNVPDLLKNLTKEGVIENVCN